MSFPDPSLHIHAAVNDAVIIQRFLSLAAQFFVGLHSSMMLY